MYNDFACAWQKHARSYRAQARRLFASVHDPLMHWILLHQARNVVCTYIVLVFTFGSRDIPYFVPCYTLQNSYPGKLMILQIFYILGQTVSWVSLITYIDTFTIATSAFSAELKICIILLRKRTKSHNWVGNSAEFVSKRLGRICYSLHAHTEHRACQRRLLSLSITPPSGFFWNFSLRHLATTLRRMKETRILIKTARCFQLRCPSFRLNTTSKLSHGDFARYCAGPSEGLKIWGC